jgi:hypothetical protein
MRDDKWVVFNRRTRRAQAILPLNAEWRLVVSMADQGSDNVAFHHFLQGRTEVIHWSWYDWSHGEVRDVKNACLHSVHKLGRALAVGSFVFNLVFKPYTSGQYHKHSTSNTYTVCIYIYIHILLHNILLYQHTVYTYTVCIQ